MPSPASERSLPPLDDVTARSHARELRRLAARFGVTNLRFASAGRLLGHIAEDRDAFDSVDFDLEATELVGAEVHIYSDRVLGKPNVSRDLLSARPLLS